VRFGWKSRGGIYTIGSKRNGRKELGIKGRSRVGGSKRRMTWVRVIGKAVGEDVGKVRC
jgi:hypothetical protein